ncbi:outer membrane protein assembly factor BamB [Thalassotalea mangrovi]|uniref:Outer membrane protein assembly factor BamB n=2 Tax=Thalassotalea mangrovi TaxID=2572245 RepID=A0A4V5NUP3_9GAMM|nr:outer membrane protein assembly factor BamB [Thalassotalea mangrovi]
MLFGCASDDEDEDTSTLVAELTEINAQFEPEVLWEQSTDEGVQHYFSRLNPVVAYDKVFTAERLGDAYAFDKTTGEEIWHVDLSNIDGSRGFFDDRETARISGGGAAGYNMVIWGSENGIVYALNQENGELIWQAKVAGEVISNPALDSNKVLVNTGSGALIALDAQTGEQLWKTEQSVPPLTLRGASGVVTSAGGAFIGNAKGELVVYIIDNGQQGWATEIGEPSGATELQRIVDVDVTPVVFGDKIYGISSNGNLAALDMRSGREVWKRKYSSYRQLTIDGNQIFATDEKGHVYAIDRNDGTELWSQLSFTNRETTGAVSIGDYVVIGDLEGYLHWLNKTDGSIVARHRVDSSAIYVTPVVDEGLIYAQSRDGELQVIKTPE